MRANDSSGCWRRWTIGFLALPLIYLANVAIVLAADRWGIHFPTWGIVVYLAGFVIALVTAGGILARTAWEIVGVLRERRRQAKVRR